MKYRIKTAAAIVAMVCGLVYAQEQWQNLYPSYTGLAFGGDFVAVSADGLIKTGNGGGQWSQYFMRGTRGLLSASYGDGVFIVTHRGIGSQSILRSEDGRAWGAQSISSNVPCQYLTFGDGKFVGIGDESTCFYDGENWEVRDAPATTSHLSHVAFGGERYVAVGGNIISSTPVQAAAGHWITASVSTPGGVNVVAFGGGKFVAIATSGSTVYTSDNGTSWTSSASNAPAGMLDMTFGDGKFVAVGSGGRVAVSADGNSWSVETLNAEDDFRAVKYGNGRFVALGAHGSVYTSTDGASWSGQANGRNMTYRQIVFGGSMFVAVGDSGISVSSDGRNWDKKDVAGKNFRGVAFGGGTFVAVGDDGAIFSSSDGSTWEDHTRNDGTTFYSVAFGGGTFIAGGMTRALVGLGGPGIYTSTDGQNWMDRSMDISSAWPSTVFPTAIAFGDDKFVAGASNGAILSTTGSAENYGRFWSNVATSAQTGSQRIATVTYSGGRFTALGTTSGNMPTATAVISSIDGSSGTWMATSAAPPASARAATFAKGYFVLAADSGNIFASQDGSGWGPTAKATNKNLTTIYFGDDKLFAAGVNGALLFSTETPVSIRETRRAPVARTSAKSFGMTMSGSGRSSTVTLSFTPERAGTIAVYSLTGRQLYKRNVAAGERIIQMPRLLTSNGSVIVKYAGGDGRVVSQRFNLIR